MYEYSDFKTHFLFTKMFCTTQGDRPGAVTVQARVTSLMGVQWTRTKTTRRQLTSDTDCNTPYTRVNIKNANYNIGRSYGTNRRSVITVINK